MEFIWVCGPSAIGKRTLIQNIFTDDLNIRDHFSICPDTSIDIAENSAFGLNSSSLDSFTAESCKKRSSLFKKILSRWGVRLLPIRIYDSSIDKIADRIAEGALDCVLIKFKLSCDCRLIERIIRKIKSPGIRHRIILLWAPPATHLNWFLKKYPDGWSDVTIRSAIKENPPNVEKAKKHLEEVWVNYYSKIMRVLQYAEKNGSDIIIEIRDVSNPYYRLISPHEIRNSFNVVS